MRILKTPIISNSCRQKNTTGFTLTELAIVLGVIGVILSVIWMATNNVYLKQKTDDASLELNTVSQNILSVWQGRNFSPAHAVKDDLTASFITSHTIPDWAVNGTAASDPWSPTGLTVVVGATSTKIFGVVFANVPPQACVVMATQAASCQNGMTGCPTQILVTGNAAGAPTTLAPTGNLWALTAETASDACTASSSTSDTVEFDYSL